MNIDITQCKNGLDVTLGFSVTSCYIICHTLAVIFAGQPLFQRVTVVIAEFCPFASSASQWSGASQTLWKRSCILLQPGEHQ